MVKKVIVRQKNATEGKLWGSKELLKFRRAYGSSTDEELASQFGCTVEEVEKQAERYALSKNKAAFHGARMPRWTSDEVSYMENHYANTPNLVIARHLGRSVRSVVSKASTMGLRKSPDRLEEMGRQNAKA